MELTVGVAVAYERLRSSERGRRVERWWSFCPSGVSREKIGNDEMFGFCISDQSIYCYIIVFEYISVRENSMVI